jgi:hypothetical protein
MKKTLTNQYMFLARGASCDSGELSPEQMQAQMQEVYAWIDGLTKKGVMTAAQPLTPEGKIVSGKNGAVAISDVMAAESKEAVGGFFIVNAASLDEAVNIARTCPTFKQSGMLEVRQMATLDSH